MTPHTPEPWKLTGSGIVAEGHKDLIGKVFYDGNNNADDNAARIVACVNGCAGLNPAKYGEVLDLLQKCLVFIAQVQSETEQADENRKALIEVGAEVYKNARAAAQEGA